VLAALPLLCLGCPERLRCARRIGRKRTRGANPAARAPGGLFRGGTQEARCPEPHTLDLRRCDTLRNISLPGEPGGSREITAPARGRVRTPCRYRTASAPGSAPGSGA